MSNKWNTFTWGLFFCALIGLCIWNIHRNRQLERALQAFQGQELPRFKQMVAGSRAVDLAISGQTLRWPEGLAVVGQGEFNHTGYRLLLTFSELSCDACRDDETQFLLDMAQNIGEGAAGILVHADSLRYVRGYMRMNGIHLPVFYDKEGAFFARNKINKTPMLLLINDRDEVLAASHAIAGETWLSQPFHNLCRRFFEELQNGNDLAMPN